MRYRQTFTYRSGIIKRHNEKIKVVDKNLKKGPLNQNWPSSTSLPPSHSRNQRCTALTMSVELPAIMEARRGSKRACNEEGLDGGRGARRYLERAVWWERSAAGKMAGTSTGPSQQVAFCEPLNA